MLFSTRSEYGVMMLTRLAQSYGQGPLSLTKIAGDLNLSVAYLEQIVPALVSHGFIESQRGAKGGYVLSQSPEKIRMGAVIRALEGRERRERKNGEKAGLGLSVMPCANLDGPAEVCGHEEVCSGPVLWMRVRDAITQALESTTLSDLAPETRRRLPLLPSIMAKLEVNSPVSVGAATEESGG
jgi:Rrf2 family cysteine metabolism transcriptional repressor